MKDALGSVQSVLVLGGGSDIALATVRELVQRRARTVVLAARDPGSLAAVADELRAAGATTVETVAFDAHDTASHDAFVADVFDRVGDIDLALLAFGVLGDQEEAEHDGRAAVDIAEVNYVGSVSVTVPIAQRMRTQGHGTIVALSSVAGERARRSNFVYGSSKAGMDAFFQGLGDSPGRERRAGDDRASRLRAHEDDRRHGRRSHVHHPRSGGRRHRARPRPQPRDGVGARADALRDVGAATRAAPGVPQAPHLSAPLEARRRQWIVDDFNSKNWVPCSSWY